MVAAFFWAVNRLILIMQRYWRCLTDRLTPQVRWICALLALVWLAGLIGNLTGLFDSGYWLKFDRSMIISAQIWRMFSYALLSDGIMDLLLTIFALLMLGPQVEQSWRRCELCSYCLLSAFGVAALCLLAPLPGAQPQGFAPVILALLVAWAMICGGSAIGVLGMGSVPAGLLAWCLGGLVCLGALMTGGLVSVLIMAAGPLIGWCYLRLRWHSNRTATAQQQASSRASKLKL